MVNASEVTKKLVTRLKGQVGLSPIEKPLLVSACFVALLDRAFCSNRETYNRKTELPGAIIQSVRKQYVCSGIAGDQMEVIDGSYKFISRLDGELLHDILAIIVHVVDPDSKSEIVDGVFNAFKAGGKGTGGVLTPYHIAEFMCELAGIDSKSVVLDTCCGTAVFVRAALKRMRETSDRR